MLQVSMLRQKTAWVKERLAIRNFKNPEWIDEIIALDDERKKMQLHVDTILSQINSASKEIGKLMALNQKEAAAQLKQEVTSNKIKITDYQNALQETEKELHEKTGFNSQPSKRKKCRLEKRLKKMK